MEFYVEWRQRGDSYNNGYGNGHTLTQSESVQKMKEIDNQNDFTRYELDDIVLTAFHKQISDGVTECRTLIENNSKNETYIELISSFALKKLKADKIHRATSFWSAEGKLLSQELTDLNFERSWANHGYRIEKFGQIGSMPVRKWFPFLVLEDGSRERIPPRSGRSPGRAERRPRILRWPRWRALTAGSSVVW